MAEKQRGDAHAVSTAQGRHSASATPAPFNVIGAHQRPLAPPYRSDIDVPALRDRQLTDERPSEPSAAIRARVVEASERQLVRFRRNGGIFANSQMEPAQIRQHCVIDAAGETLLHTAIRRLGLSTRAYHRVLRLARTIADLAGTDRIATVHLAEAIQYRSLDRRGAGLPAASLGS